MCGRFERESFTCETAAENHMQWVTLIRLGLVFQHQTPSMASSTKATLASGYRFLSLLEKHPNRKRSKRLSESAPSPPIQSVGLYAPGAELLSVQPSLRLQMPLFCSNSAPVIGEFPDRQLGRRLASIWRTTRDRRRHEMLVIALSLF